MRWIRTVAFLGISVFTPLAGLADTTGSVRGYVVPGSHDRDCVKSLVPRVVVTYSSPADTFSVRPDANGFYVIFGIPPGKYAIDVRVPGQYDLLLSPAHVCLHAGDNLYRNLRIGFRDLPNAWAIERLDYLAQFTPDASQTADVYNVGSC